MTTLDESATSCQLAYPSTGPEIPHSHMKILAKAIAKWIGIVLLIIIVLLAGAYFYLNEPLPSGINSTEADLLANRMLAAVHEKEWQNTPIVTWTSPGHQVYVWDKKRNLVAVSWSRNWVLLNLSDWPKGKAFVENREQTGNELDVLRGKAWAYFCNDSYWLIAPTKVFDEGVERRTVAQPDGSQALLVTYRSGGVTPGDSYLWFLDWNGLPTKYKMWVSIIPIGGVEATWEGWVKLKTGALVPSKHQLGPLALRITDIKAGDSFQNLGLSVDPFLGVE
jgi:hypothetical protein